MTRLPSLAVIRCWRHWRGGGRPSARPPGPPGWLALCSLPAVAALIALATGSGADGQLLLPLLAVPPALAGIGAATPRRPLAYGAVMLLAAIVTAPFTTTPELPVATAVSVLAVTAISASGGARGGQQQNQRLADVTSVAEAAQRALLRPLPRQVGPLELGVVYLAAAAEARVGGDLYEVTRTQFGIRLIVGDVRGKGLDAVEIAADVLGVFREVAHEVYTLAEVARRIDASLARRPAAPLEEFVTAVLAEIDPAAGRLTVYNCGHPPPLVLSTGAGGRGDGPRVTTVDVPAPALPLRLMSLGGTSGAERTMPLQPGDALLLYTDGVTEARDARREFYPLEDRVAALGRQDRRPRRGPAGPAARRPGAARGRAARRRRGAAARPGHRRVGRRGRAALTRPAP